MKTHRCEGSLKAKSSIRYCRFMEGYNLEEDFNRLTWRLYKYYNDWNCYSRDNFGEIKYCPYCGEKLE